MCWPHANRKIKDHLKPITSINKTLSQQVLEDVETFQWVVTPSSFEKDLKSLENKYLKERESTEHELEALKTFFEYFWFQWGPKSKTMNWFEHAFPFHIGHNQSMEGKNLQIKESHTFKRRVGIGEFFKVCERMLREFGEEDDTLLKEGGRLAALLKPDFKDGQDKTGLALMTEGWKWAHDFRKGVPNKVVRVDPLLSNYYTVAEEHNLGEVDQLYAVNKTGSTKPLKEKILAKLEERKHPSNRSWDEKKKILSACFFIEERAGDFYCDCWGGIKGRMCEHTVGMHYRQKTGRLPVTEEVRSLPIGAKRPRGRPKKLAGCRVRSPVKAPPPAPTALDVSTENLEVGTVQVPVVQVAAPEPCTSCAEDGAVGLAEAYCAECSDHMCEEHRMAHAKTRVTKNHRIIYVRNLVIEEEQLQEVQVPELQVPVVQVQEVPGQEEVQGQEVQVPAVQEVVQEDSRVTCNFCHSKVSKKSLKGHERTQKCRLSRPALAQKRGAEESAPCPPLTRRRVASGSK